MPLSYEEGNNNNNTRPSWRHEMMPLLNFLILVGLFLIGLFWFLGNSGGSSHELPEVPDCGDQSIPHKIIPGDTCWSLAEANHVSLDRLLEENQELDCDSLSVGGTICVPKT